MRVINQANFNNDGLDPDGCTNVIVRNCVINSEDDAMCLKGASDLPSRNILIENSTFVSTCNAFKVGTDTQGDFKDILVRNVILGGTPEGMESIRGRRASTGITIATVDGGDIEDLVMQNVTINQSRCPIFIRIGDRGRVITDQKPKPGRIERVLIENVTGERNQSQGSFISGIADYMVSDVTIKNYNVKIEGGGTASMVLQNVVEGVDGYPDAHQFSPQGLPAYGFYFRHAKNISMEGMRVTPIAPDQRPEIYNGGDAYNILYNDLFIKDLFIPPWKRRQMEAAAAKLKAQQAATK